MSYYQELATLIKEQKPNKRELSRLKTDLCKKHGLREIPTDIQILINTPQEDVAAIKQYVQSKPQRSISGVAPVAIFAKPAKCPHGTCTYCPGGRGSVFGDVPQAYTGKEPATRRAIRNHYDPYLQVMNRLEQYMVLGHVPDKADLIIMGGTFPAFPRRYKEEFMLFAYKAMNDFSKLFFKEKEFQRDTFRELFELPGDIKDPNRQKRVHEKLLALKEENIRPLEREQEDNETAMIRCIGLTIETRPDNAQLTHANEMLRWGTTRVEVGVQTLRDEVLHRIKRKQTVADAIESTRILKDLGFKINYHMMPGLPDVTREEDLHDLKRLFTDEEFRPDMLKLYPCMVLKGTELYDEFVAGTFTPMTTPEAAKLIAEFMRHVPEYCRIMRVQRDIPTYMTDGGVDKTNLRQYIDKELEKKGIVCRDIRSREIGRSDIAVTDPKIIVREYDASKGKEFFIASEQDDKLIGFCRLRFISEPMREEFTKESAIIREVHVYGEATKLGEQGKIQHRGIGKALVKEAERLAREAGKDKLLVISGVGVREYYRKLGYHKEGPYMVKFLTNK